jgi:hypothetical protein
VRKCCDPCDDPTAETLRDGTRVLHLTNFYRGATWGPIEFAFYELVDPDDPESGPDLTSPVDLGDSTWELNIYDAAGELWGSFDDWDTSDHATGQVYGSLTDTELTAAAAVGVDCAPTYIFELIQTRDGQTAVPFIGTIQVAHVSALTSLLGV